MLIRSHKASSRARGAPFIVAVLSWAAGCAQPDPNAEAWEACESVFPQFFSHHCPLALSCEDLDRTFEEAVADTREAFAGCYAVEQCHSQGSFAIDAGYTYCGEGFEAIWFFDRNGTLVGVNAGGPSGLFSYYAYVVEDPAVCPQPSRAFQGNPGVLFGDDAGCFEDLVSHDPDRYCVSEMESYNTPSGVDWCDGSGG